MHHSTTHIVTLYSNILINIGFTRIIKRNPLQVTDRQWWLVANYWFYPLKKVLNMFNIEYFWHGMNDADEMLVDGASLWPNVYLTLPIFTYFKMSTSTRLNYGFGVGRLCEGNNWKKWNITLRNSLKNEMTFFDKPLTIQYNKVFKKDSFNHKFKNPIIGWICLILILEWLHQ